jgi:hypothetical protein
MVLLILSLLLALVMGISLTSISEAGVTNTYANQTRAFQAAEAGLHHSLSLVKNFTNGAAGHPDFTKLMALRVSPAPTAAGEPCTNYLVGNNPFTDASYFSPGSTMISDALSGGTPILNSAGNPIGHQLVDASGAVVPGAYYSVHVIDDEASTSAAVVKVPNFVPTGWENGDAKIDQNNRIVVYSTGTYGNSSVTLEGWIAFVPYPALVAQQDITVWGNSVIQGAYGGVHSNGNLDIGGSASIEKTATAVGSFTEGTGTTIGGFHAGGQEPIYIPKFVTTDPLSSGGPNTTPRIQDYLIQRADTILIDAGYGTGTDPQGMDGLARSNALAARLNVDAAQLWAAINSTSQEVAVTISRSCDTCLGSVTQVPNVADTGWKYSAGSGWDVQTSAVDNHNFYVVGKDNYSSQENGGKVKVTTNLGTAGAPIHITIMSTGSIDIESTPVYAANLTDLSTPELPPFVTINLLLLAVEDIKIKGNAGVPTFSGIIFGGEQFDLSGNGSFDGQVISLGNPHITGSPVSSNNLQGNFTLTFNGGQSLGRVSLMSWRQIKE